jgi:hypothetical protein
MKRCVAGFVDLPLIPPGGSSRAPVNRDRLYEADTREPHCADRSGVASTL